MTDTDSRINITMYHNHSEKNKVDKICTQVGQILTGSFKNDCDLVNPIIQLNVDISIKGVNYIYIEELERFYFVNKIVYIRTGLAEIYCHCDVLSSHKAQIRKNIAIIERQENNFNLYINDAEIKSEQKQEIQLKQFPYAFSNNFTYIIAMSG